MKISPLKSISVLMTILGTLSFTQAKYDHYGEYKVRDQAIEIYVFPTFHMLNGEDIPLTDLDCTFMVGEPENLPIDFTPRDLDAHDPDNYFTVNGGRLILTSSLLGENDEAIKQKLFKEDRFTRTAVCRASFQNGKVSELTLNGFHYTFQHTGTGQWFLDIPEDPHQ